MGRIDKDYREQPIKVYQADLIDINDEYLIYKWEFWLLEHGKDLPEEVKNFIAWCREENKKDMHCKRAGDGKSFYERREEAKHYEQLGRSRTEERGGEKASE